MTCLMEEIFKERALTTVWPGHRDSVYNSHPFYSTQTLFTCAGIVSNVQSTGIIFQVIAVAEGASILRQKTQS